MLFRRARAFAPEQVIALLRSDRVTELSLDHDLGLEPGRTGYAVLVWLEREVAAGRSPRPLPEISVHSANPVGRRRMLRRPVPSDSNQRIDSATTELSLSPTASPSDSTLAQITSLSLAPARPPLSRRLRTYPRLITLSRVEPSEEIRRVVERWTKAVAEGDHESALERLSELPGTLIIGNDPNEWWHGEEARAIWARQLEELGSFPLTSYEVEAWEEGTVGWASVKETITSSGTSFDGRSTYVLHLERGEWKVVQVHWSLAKPNVEFLGRVLTTSLDELERTLQRERPDLSGTLAADGTVTIVFTDIVDSTVLIRQLGDHAWLPLLRRHNAVIEAATAVHGGTVVETQGDGSMLAFSSARRAVSCAKSIQREVASAFADGAPPVRVRIGLHTGDALHEADQFFGTTVHYAARVASHALAGEILVSSVVRDLVAGGPDMEFLEEREVQLKELDGRHRLFAVEPA